MRYTEKMVIYTGNGEIKNRKIIVREEKAVDIRKEKNTFFRNVWY